MHRALWQYSIAELDKEIAITKAFLASLGYHKLAADRLAVLQEQREERLIEESIIAQSAIGKEWW